MIETLSVSNFRSLGPSTRIKFGPLSVLVGPNGSGKSNVLDVLSFVRDAVLLGLPAAITHRRGIGSVRRRSGGVPFDVRVEMTMGLNPGKALYSFEIGGDRAEEYRVKSESASVDRLGESARFDRAGNHWTGPEGLAPRVDEQSLALTALGGDDRFRGLVDFLGGMTVYSIFPDMLREPQKYDPAHPMKSHGENWVSVLREMVKTDAKDDLIAGLGKLTGDIQDARVTPAAGYLVAEFKQRIPAKKGKRWFDAAQQSDGTLRVAGLLTALLQFPTVPVIGIEEPELTVHPGALPLLYDYLRQASEASQVIFTTHSPIVLDVVDVERDRVFVVDRRDGVTLVRPVDCFHLQPVKAKLLSLGDLLLTGELQLGLFDAREP